MVMYLLTRWYGSFLIEDAMVIDKYLYQDIESVTNCLRSVSNHEILDQERTLATSHEVQVDEPRLRSLGRYDPDSISICDIDLSGVCDVDVVILHEASLRIARCEMDKALSSQDFQVIQMVNALDDLIKTSNLLLERELCWELVPTAEEKKEPFDRVRSQVESSLMGMQDEIVSAMATVAPNISSVAGPLIGARLISIAGGLNRLAMMPASTIQMLGAEKALFRHKKTGSRPPKHGVIFQHSLICHSPRTIRGNLARVISCKIAIAAKADAFTHNDIADELKQSLEEASENIRKSKMLMNSVSN